MKQSMLVLLAVVLGSALVAQEYRLYHTGLRDGETQYKQSHRIYMAFKSAYHYGYTDCKEGRAENWEGDE